MATSYMRVWLAVCCCFMFYFVTGQDYKDALFIGLTKGFTGRMNPVIFDQEDVDTKNVYDIRGGRFFASKKGAYWLSLSAGAWPSKDVSVDLYGNTAPVCGAIKASENNDGLTTFSRDIMVQAERFQSFHVQSSRYLSGMYSDSGLLSSVSMFRLSDLMKTNVFFSVARKSNFKGETSEIIPFTEVLINEGNAFDSQDSCFNAPKNGLYFFSFSAGVFSNETIDCILRKGATVLGSLERHSTAPDDVDMMSRGGMFYLAKDDVVFVHLSRTSSVFARSGLETSWSGFLYEPVHDMLHAWSVARTTSWQSDISLNPIAFDEVLVNEGQGWNKDENVYVCPVAGIYYVTVTVGAQAHKGVYVNIMVNLKKKATVVRKATNHNGMDMLSRSVVLYAKEGSWIYLSAEGNTAIYSTRDRHTSFTGLFLFSYAKPQA